MARSEPFLFLTVESKFILLGADKDYYSFDLFVGDIGYCGHVAEGPVMLADAIANRGPIRIISVMTGLVHDRQL